jgi:hypothetical protein
MDFRQTSQTSNNRQEHTAAATGTKTVRVSNDNSFAKAGWLTWLKGLVLLGALFLLLASGLALLKGGNVVKEGGLVNTSRYQAVFLNNGQVYFGKAKQINNRFVTLDDVYYLTQATSTGTQATGDYTLVKLGCQQIHYPEDRMVISRDQVTFWENLSTKGKVAKSIADFKAKYPNGPDCTEQTSQTPATNTPSQASNNATQSTNNTTTNNTTTR